MHLQVDSCESCLNMLDQCLLRVSFLNYQLPGFRGENAPPLENKELDEFVPEVGIEEASRKPLPIISKTLFTIGDFDLIVLYER